MTVRSVPVHLDKDYDLRFEQDDVIACEEELKMGYTFFFRVEKLDDSLIPTTLSLKLLRSLIHHGLRNRTDTGMLVYAIPQTPEGARQAGNLIQVYKQNGGNDVELWIKCREAFSDWFATPEDNKGKDKKPDEKEQDTKNLRPAGKNQRSR
jgi:hypothetical protein